MYASLKEFSHSYKSIMPGGSWQDSCSRVENALNYMWRKEIAVDFELKHESGRSLYAHKLVLSLWSPAFAELSKKYANMSKVKFKEDYEAMEIMLRYMYTSDESICLTKMPLDKLIKVLEAAERYRVVQLQEKCLASIVRRKIDPYNVLEIFDFGIRKEHNQIRQKCLHVLKNIGIDLKHMREEISLVCILAILTQERLALSSEAQLLRMAISWLSYPKNMCYKPEILSFIDLSSIEWTEYQNILKDFPNFFTEKELVSILMGMALTDAERFPEWYKARVTSYAHNCASCTCVMKRINVLEHLNLLQVGNTEEANTYVSHSFRIVYNQQLFPTLVQIELGFGPKNIPEEEFSMTYKIHSSNKAGVTKPCFLDNNQKQNTNNYIIKLNDNTALKSDDRLTFTFKFKNTFNAYGIKAVQPVACERQKLWKVEANQSISVTLTSLASLFIFAPQDMPPKFLMSSFTFRFCKDHFEYLRRKIHEPKLLEPPVKKLKTEHYFPVEVHNIKKEEETLVTLK